MSMHLPRLNSSLASKMRKDLKYYGAIAKIVQVISGVALGILEGILINMATSAQGDRQTKLFVYLAIVAVVHLSFFAVTLFSITPLPEFLVEFDSLSERMKELEAEAEVYKQYTQIYNASVIAAQISLSAIEVRTRDPRRKLDEVLTEVLMPWTTSRAQIFRFYDDEAVYNFAVYEFLEQHNRLRIIWRRHDDRLKTHNREWAPGFGHIGVCFQQGKTIFSDDVSRADTDNPITTDNQEDKKNYKSMVSTPIFVDGNKKGVFIITSSRPDQFDKELHSPIVEVMAMLLGQAMKHGWTKNKQNP